MKTALFISLCLSILTQNVSGQNDNYYRRSDSTDVNNTVNSGYVADMSSKQLVKVGLALPILRQSSFRGFYRTVAFNLIAEQKTKGFSLLAGLQANVGFANEAQLFQLELPLDLRYYFSIGKRMRQRLDRHSFFSYYVGLHTQNVIHSRFKYERSAGFGNLIIDRYRRGQILSQNVNNGLIYESFSFLEYAHLQVGRQFKMFKRCFLDANVVVPVSAFVYNKRDYTLSSPAFATISFGYLIARK